VTGLFLSRLPLLAVLCAAVAVLGWAALTEIKRDRPGASRRARPFDKRRPGP